MKRKLKQIIADAEKYLQGDFTREDIFWLAEELFHLKKYELYSRGDDVFEDALFLEYVQKAVNVPVSYLLGYHDFFLYRFSVTPDVLIPRPETEELVERILRDIPQKDRLSILDVGTGSGCIAVTLEKELEKREIAHAVFASDISEEALKIARRNAEQLRADVRFFLSDCLEQIPELPLDILVSNPPYIRKGSFVAARVKQNEPSLALYAEEDGLEFYHRILEASGRRYPELCMYFEISPELEEGLSLLAARYFPRHKIEFFRDMNHLLRFAKISLK